MLTITKMQFLVKRDNWAYERFNMPCTYIHTYAYLYVCAFFVIQKFCLEFLDRAFFWAVAPAKAGESLKHTTAIEVLME